MRLKGRTVIVTGAGRNLGRASAELFAEEGAAVVVADLNAKDAEAVADAIRGKGGKAHAVTTDVTSEKSCEAMVAAAEKQFGALHGIFNNAGIMMPDDEGPVETPLASWDKTMLVNLTGVFLCCKAAVPAVNALVDDARLPKLTAVAMEDRVERGLFRQDLGAKYPVAQISKASVIGLVDKEFPRLFLVREGVIVAVWDRDIPSADAILEKRES